MWALHYRKGRVFTTALGHDLRSVRTPGFVATFQRGVEWAATGESPSRRPRHCGTGSETDPPDGSGTVGAHRGAEQSVIAAPVSSVATG